MNNKQFLQQLFQVAVDASMPSSCMQEYLKDIDNGQQVCIIGAGKASFEMAKVAEQHFDKRCFGAIVCRHGYTEQTSIGRIDVLFGGHPIPDSGSHHAASKILELVQSVDASIPVIVLISGGGSALLSSPIDGVTFAQKMQLNKFLLASGASIDEINCVRTHLSRIKGGKLAQAINGRSHTLIISDVVGDDPQVIASGPTVKNHTSAQQALAILAKYHWQGDSAIVKALADAPQQQDWDDTRHQLSIIANAQQSIDKAIATIDQSQWQVEILNYNETGDATQVAQQHAKLAIAAKGQGKATLLLSGGELTVTLCDEPGHGGPNQEYLLALAIALNGESGISALACDTDGVDGSLDVAGAFINDTTLVRAQQLTLDANQTLASNSSHHFFQQLNDLIITGPTHTNVNDFRVIMIEPQ
ncbi:glycerate kinase [Psychrobium sp. MM17-31]|uniref:glycerate kinase type-2 family protein n=1 Tax=Psychrobium sp. MM17-31 TaxID=2917758 RepID=UPI001EF60CC3|nr:glycerate kinase [Psychrobium sp. MM17-31]MCG7532130.1 glycerate kinase [Psychrobium sp. MM17-31]